MSNIDKQALIAKIKKQTESFDTVVLQEDEANALLDELEAKDNQLSVQRDYYEGVIADGSKRISELEAREVKLPDINNYLSDVTEPTLDRALRLTAKGVRSGDVAAIRAAGIRIKGEG